MKLFTPFFVLARTVLALAIILPAFEIRVFAQGQAQVPQTRDQMDFEKAGSLAEQGKYEAAAKLYEGIPNNYPTSPLIPQAALRLGYTYFRMSLWDQALKVLEKVPTIKGASPDIVELATSLVPAGTLRQGSHFPGWKKPAGRRLSKRR